MRIVCPSCAATYEVPERLLSGAPRSMRCSRCGVDFTPPRPEAPPALPIVSDPEPIAAAPVAPAAPPAEADPPPPVAPTPVVPERTPVAAPPPAPSALARAWIVSLALVLGAAVALVLLRAQVMAAWPPATRLFAALGLA
jgi:predicted Zn finger-like uncharacterized protein